MLGIPRTNGGKYLGVELFNARAVEGDLADRAGRILAVVVPEEMGERVGDELVAGDVLSGNVRDFEEASDAVGE